MYHLVPWKKNYDKKFVVSQDLFPTQYSYFKRIHVDLKNLPLKHELQEKNSSYHPNDHDEIRKYYSQNGYC